MLPKQSNYDLTNNAATLVVSHARKSYTSIDQTVWALDDVSFNLRNGEVASIIGTNGSGKSTLLQAIAGLLPLEEGSIQLDGRNVSHIGSRDLARTRAILYQHPLRNLCPGFSIDEMITLYEDGINGASFEDLLKSMERIGLDPSRTVSTLSGGQQQLLALELVLARHPELILLDEPTASLDMENASLVRTRVRDAASSGISVVFVSHDLEEALAVADHLIYLHQGKLVKHWQSEELASLNENALRDFVRKSVVPGTATAAVTRDAEIYKSL